MGILYKVSIEMKRQHIIQELLAKGITQDKNGKSIYDMDYDDLKHELVMWSFRQIDAERDSNKWF